MRMAKITELAQRNAASQDSDKETVAQANSSKHLGLSSQSLFMCLEVFPKSAAKE